jgi:hypothetical protein
LLKRAVLNSWTRKVVNMGRPFYPHEADDPDLDWLVSNFLYERPSYLPIETGSLPLVLLPYQEEHDEGELIDEITDHLPEKEKELTEVTRPEK